MEIWQNCREQAGYGEVAEALQRSAWLKERLDCERGVWSLKPPFRDDILSRSDQRNRRYRTAKHKLDRARNFARFARRMPGVRGIYVCNSLGFLQAQAGSDIDLFVKVKRGCLWTARFFLVLLAKMFGRPRPEQTPDGICLSFFAVEGAHMKNVALPGGDVYYEHWQKNLLPLTSLTWPMATLSRRERGWGEGIGRVVERVLRWIQLKILPAPLKALANKGTGVVINDEFLKFHDHDKREYFRKEWVRKLTRVAG